MDTNSAMVLRPTQNRTSHDRDPFRAPAPVKSQVVLVEIRPHLLRESKHVFVVEPKFHRHLRYSSSGCSSNTAWAIACARGSYWWWSS